jgi:prepilin-type N-terminal cleavage/methylation domain-containing protein
VLIHSINKARAKGVSLVEIMVVIGIIGILMMIALPSYQVWMQNS